MVLYGLETRLALLNFLLNMDIRKHIVYDNLDIQEIVL